MWLHRSGTVVLTTLEVLELHSLDILFRLRGPRPAGDEVVLLAYDDRTLEDAPLLFERRAGHAEVIRAVHAAGARVMGIDLWYSEPEQLLKTALVADIDAYMDVEPAEPVEEPLAQARGLLDRVQSEVHGDEELRLALKDTKFVVLGFHLGDQGNLENDDRSLSKGKYGQTVPGAFLPEEMGRVIASEPAFNRAAKGLGIMTTYQDLTGSVRDVPLAVGMGPSVFMPLSVHLVARYEGINRGQLAYLGNTGTVSLGERELHVEQNKMMLLNYRGAGAFPTYSVVDVVEGNLPEGALEDKIAILGFTHLASDSVQTPFGRRPGMEVHATAVDNILHGDPIRRAPPWFDALLTFAAGVLASLAFVSRRLGAIGQVAAASMAVGAVLVGSYALFALGDVWAVASAPLFTGALATLTGVATAYLQEGVQKRYLRKTFAHYLSDELVQELVADPSRVSLTGQRRELSVLFSDIRGFTTFSERTDPEDLASFLNAYFTPMTQAVLDNSGYVDKFIGDAIMALFGAPVAREAHARDAICCALAMHAALESVRPRAESMGIELAIGVGVNSGEMVVGNLGSESRFDYTVLGDAVNLASRLEGLTKRYGVFCLVGEATAREVAGEFELRSVDLVRVKGKGEPVELFELLSGNGVTLRTVVGAEGWAAAQAAYRRGDFTTARRMFESFDVDNPGDPVTAVYLERLDHLGDVAPADWDGVFTHTKK